MMDIMIMNTVITEVAIRTMSIAVSYNIIIGMLWNSPSFLGKYLALHAEYKEDKLEKSTAIKLKTVHWVILDALFNGIGIWYVYEEFFKKLMLEGFSLSMMVLAFWGFSVFELLVRERDSKERLTIKYFFSHTIYSLIMIAGTIFIVTNPI